MIHVTTLRSSGFDRIRPGARIRVKAFKKPRGLSACHVISMDAPPAPAGSDWEDATVTWFNKMRGFGFLTRGIGTEDIFVHMETVRMCNFTGLRPRQRLRVRWAMGDKGPAAVEIASIV